MVQPELDNRPTPFATGRLAERPLAHLLVYVLERKLSGSFELLSEHGGQVQIVVQGGMIARVATSEPVAYLGHVLYESGAIDDVQLGQSLAVVAATKRLHGQVLLARGMIDAGVLAEGLRRQRARKLHHAFELPPETTFAFYPGVELVGPRPSDVEPMDPLPSIWRGVLLHPPYEHVRSTLATVGERPLRMVGPIERLGLDGEELETVERLRRTETTAAALPRLAGLEARRAELLAYFLVITKMAELRHRADTSGPPSSSAPSSRPRPEARGVTAVSGEYPRTMSFAMRAAQTDQQPLRIPSPMPGARGAPSSSPKIEATAPETARRVEADHALSQAEMHCVLGDREEAMAHARKALLKEPGMPEAMALLAYLQILGPSSEEASVLQRSLDLANAAIGKKASCRRGHFYRAEIKKRMDDDEGAIHDLRVAVASDPNDVEARRELRIYEQKLKDGSVKLGVASSGEHHKSKGLLDRLRGVKR
jgi:tetratricopeptide (TPR) repeat protein